MTYDTYDMFAELLLMQSRRRNLQTTTERLSYLIFTCNLSEQEARKVEQVADIYSDYTIDGEDNTHNERLY